MKTIGHNLNLDVKAVINFPPKVKIPKPITTWKRKKVWFEVEEVKLKNKLESVTKSAFGFGVSAALSFCIFFHAPPALAQSLTVAFPVSRAPEVFFIFTLSI